MGNFCTNETIESYDREKKLPFHHSGQHLDIETRKGAIMSIDGCHVRSFSGASDHEPSRGALGFSGAPASHFRTLQQEVGARESANYVGYGLEPGVFADSSDVIAWP